MLRVGMHTVGTCEAAYGFPRRTVGTRGKNTNTGEIWSPSNTNHSNSEGGEWKVGPRPGVPPRPGNKITVSSGGAVIKID